MLNVPHNVNVVSFCTFIYKKNSRNQNCIKEQLNSFFFLTFLMSQKACQMLNFGFTSTILKTSSTLIMLIAQVRDLYSYVIGKS